MEKQNPFSLAFWKNRTQLLLLLYAVSLLLLFLLAKLFLPLASGESASLSLALVLIFSVFLPSAFCLYMEDAEIFTVKDGSFSVHMLGRLLSAALAAFAAALGYKALLLFLGKDFAYSVLTLSPMDLTPLSFLSFAILPAILEEWLCRGLVFSRLRHYGAVAVSLLTALLSAVLYFPSPLALPFFLLLGLLLGLVRVSVGSVYPSLLIAVILRGLLLYDAVKPFPFWHLEGQNMLLLALGGLFLFLLFGAFALVYPRMRHLLKSGKAEGASPLSLFLSPIFLTVAMMTLLFYFLLY